jgi:hypothetical protein
MARPDWVYKVVENLVNSIKVQEFNVCKNIGHIFIIPCEPFFIATQSLACVKVLLKNEKNHYFEPTLKQTSLDKLTNGSLRLLNWCFSNLDLLLAYHGILVNGFGRLAKV